MRRWICLLLTMVLSLAPSARGDVVIKAKELVKGGDRVGEVRANNPISYPFRVGGINDLPAVPFVGEYIEHDDFLGLRSGSQLDLILKFGDLFDGDKITKLGNVPFDVITPISSAGHLLIPTMIGASEALLQAASGKLSLITRLPDGGYLTRRPQMNKSGVVVYATRARRGAGGLSDTFQSFVYDPSSPPARRLDAPGVVAYVDANGVSWKFAGDPEGDTDYNTPCSNSKGEMAFVGRVESAEGKTRWGVFFRTTDGQIQPAVVQDQPLPGGFVIEEARSLRLSEASVLTFQARRKTDYDRNVQAMSVYSWNAETNTISAVFSLDRDGPPGVPFQSINGVWVNDRNRKVLVSAQPTGASDYNLYLLDQGTVTPVMLARQTALPGGGLFRWATKVTDANASGQRLALAVGKIADDDFNNVGVFQMGPEGELALLARTGMSIDLGSSQGQIWSIADAAGPNNKNQSAVSLVVREADQYRPYVVLIELDTP